MHLNPEQLVNLRANYTMYHPDRENSMVLDTTDLTAEAAAGRIWEHIQGIFL